MKTKTILICSCMVVIAMLFNYHTHAQTQSRQAVNPEYITGKKAVAEFTWKIFQAPNKMYGYDIFKDSKLLFHQAASFSKTDNSVAALSTKDQADKAAVFAIEKIKKGQPAQLPQEEIKKIIGR